MVTPSNNSKSDKIIAIPKEDALSPLSISGVIPYGVQQILQLPKAALNAAYSTAQKVSDVVTPVWKHGAMGVVVGGRLTGVREPDEKVQELWQLYQQHKEPLIAAIQKILNSDWKLRALFISEKTIEDAVDQTIYALLLGVQQRLEEKGEEPTLKNIFSTILNALEKAAEAEESEALDVLLKNLVESRDAVPLSDFAIGRLSKSVQNFLKEQVGTFRAVFTAFTSSQDAADHWLNGISAEEVEIALQASSKEQVRAVLVGVPEKELKRFSQASSEEEKKRVLRGFSRKEIQQVQSTSSKEEICQILAGVPQECIDSILLVKELVTGHIAKEEIVDLLREIKRSDWSGGAAGNILLKKILLVRLKNKQEIENWIKEQFSLDEGLLTVVNKASGIYLSPEDIVGLMIEAKSIDELRDAFGIEKAKDLLEREYDKIHRLLEGDLENAEPALAEKIREFYESEQAAIQSLANQFIEEELADFRPFGAVVKLRHALELAYDEVKAKEIAEKIQNFIDHFVDSALTKINTSEDKITHVLKVLLGGESDLQNTLAKVFTHVLSKSEFKKHPMKALLTACLMNLTEKFIVKNPKVVKEHEEGAVAVALCTFIEKQVEVVTALFVSSTEGERKTVFQEMIKELSETFGLSTEQDIVEVWAPLSLPRNAALQISHSIGSYISDLTESFYDQITGCLREETILRGRVRNVFGIDATANGKTPAEFAADQIADYTKRLLPHMLSYDREMLAQSTVGSLNDQFQVYFNEPLFSDVGALGPQRVLETTYDKLGEHLPQEAWKLVAKLVDNTCLKAFSMLGEKIKAFEESRGSKEAVLEIVKAVLNLVREHFETIKQEKQSAHKSGHKEELWTTFASQRRLDPALQADADKIEQFYRPLFGEILLEMGDVTEEVLPLDPLVRGTLFNLVQETVLPSVLESVFSMFVEPENLNRLLINTLRQQREKIPAGGETTNPATAATTRIEIEEVRDNGLEEEIQSIIHEALTAFPSSLVTLLIDLVNSDFLQAKGVIAPLVAQSVEDLLVEQRDGGEERSKLIAILNQLLSTIDLRQTGPNPPIDPVERDIDKMNAEELKKVLRQEITRAVEESLKTSWKQLWNRCQSVIDPAAGWLERHVHSWTAHLLRFLWKTVTGVLFALIFPLAFAAEQVILLYTWIKALHIQRVINMPIHENLILGATRKIMEELKSETLRARPLPEEIESEIESLYSWNISSSLNHAEKSALFLPLEKLKEKLKESIRSAREREQRKVRHSPEAVSKLQEDIDEFFRSQAYTSLDEEKKRSVEEYLGKICSLLENFSIRRPRRINPE